MASNTDFDLSDIAVSEETARKALNEFLLNNREWAKDVSSQIEEVSHANFESGIIGLTSETRNSRLNTAITLCYSYGIRKSGALRNRLVLLSKAGGEWLC